jgi:hypothetical protein
MKTSLAHLIQRFVFAILAVGLLPTGAASVAAATPQAAGGFPSGKIKMADAPFVSLGPSLMQHSDVLAEAGKLGLKGADKVLDGLDAVQDSPYYLPADAGMSITKDLGEAITKALAEGKDIGELLNKHKDTLKGAGDKIKVITIVLKSLKVAHFTGHVIETYNSGDRKLFTEALHNAVKEGLKMGGEFTGSWAGGALGAKAGAAIGVWFGGVGAVPGAIIGGAVGSWVGGKTVETGAGWVTDTFFKDSIKDLADWAFDKKHGPEKKPKLPSPLPESSSGTPGGADSSSQAPPKLKPFR